MTPVLDLQHPRICHFPESHSSAGAEAVDLSAMAGLFLDPWQAFVLEHSLAERPDGKWAAFEVGVCVPRQNGKGAILEARELAGLFLLGEPLIIHSAHQFDTSLEAFRRLLGLIEETPELSRRIKRVSRSHGEEGITLTNGQRVRFRTRTKGGGRGFSCSCLILDEAMILPDSSHGALLPTLSAQPNPQVWYTGSAVDQLVHQDGVVWARVRERGIAGDDPSLAYFEWSAMDAPDPSHLAPEVTVDRDAWATANPGLGIRILPEHVEHERRSMDPRGFAVERLGVGDWPSTDPYGDSVIDLAQWRLLTDGASAMLDPVCFAFDVTPERASSSIAAAGLRRDGLIHVEVIDRRPGTGWLADRVAELCQRHEPSAVLCDSASPAASLVEEMKAAGVNVRPLPATENVKACGHLYDLVEQTRLRHRGTDDLESAILGAARRPLVDAWAWSRKSSRVDISPLVAVTLAAWGAGTRHPANFVFEVL